MLGFGVKYEMSKDFTLFTRISHFEFCDFDKWDTPFNHATLFQH